MFVHFEKAFDRVNREYIGSALSRRGIPEKIIAIILKSYLNVSYRVLHSGQLSKSFKIKQGVRQGVSDIVCNSHGRCSYCNCEWKKKWHTLATI
jgi:hypothetical protein